MSGRAQPPEGTFASRLRDRRIAAGLSQTELAADDLSPSYVSLLEAGKRTPTSGIAEVLAGRLGCTSGYLLHGDDPDVAARVTLAITYAELALRNGEAADALAQVERVADEENMAQGLRTRAETARAKALEAVGRLEEAAEGFEALARRAEAEHSWGDYLERVVDLVRCYQEAGDVNHSLDLATAALERVRHLQMEGTDVHAQLAATIVGAYYVRGDLTKAAISARDALRAVENRGSARAVGSVLWNASLVEEAKDNIDDALLLATKALALFADGDDARALARLQVAYGWLLLRSAPPQAAEARKVLKKAHTALRDVGTEIDLAYCETELARAALVLGEAKTALDLAETAFARYRGAVRLETAATDLVRARALMTLGDKAGAIRHYRAAAATLGRLEVSKPAAAAWRELADAYTDLSMFKDAALAYQQALTEAGIRAASLTSETPEPRERHHSTRGKASTPET